MEVEEMKLRTSRDLNHERETERMKATELKISTKWGVSRILFPGVEFGTSRWRLGTTAALLQSRPPAIRV